MKKIQQQKGVRVVFQSSTCNFCAFGKHKKSGVDSFLIIVIINFAADEEHCPVPDTATPGHYELPAWWNYRHQVSRVKLKPAESQARGVLWVS